MSDTTEAVTHSDDYFLTDQRLVWNDLAMLGMLYFLSVLIYFVDVLYQDINYLDGFPVAGVTASCIIVFYGSRVILKGGYVGQQAIEIAVKTVVKALIVRALFRALTFTMPVQFALFGIGFALLILCLYLFKRYHSPFVKPVRVTVTSCMVLAGIVNLMVHDYSDYSDMLCGMFYLWSFVLVILYVNYTDIVCITRKVHSKARSSKEVKNILFYALFTVCIVVSLISWILCPEAFYGAEIESFLPIYGSDLGIAETVDVLVWMIFGLSWSIWAVKIFRLNDGMSLIKVVLLLNLICCIYWVFEPLISIGDSVLINLTANICYHIIYCSIALTAVHLHRSGYTYWAAFLLTSSTALMVYASFFGGEYWYLMVEFVANMFFIVFDFLTTRGFVGKAYLDD